MSKSDKREFYSGTSGLMLPVKNKSFYPPEYQNRSRLEYYGSLFNSIEINSSFYKLPLPRTVAAWAEQVPDNFRFTFKLWRDITHVKGLAFRPEDVSRFFDIIKQAGDKKGCVLVQFPPGFKIGMVSRLEDLCRAIKDADPGSEWNISIEFRNESWYDDSVYDMIERFGFGIVIHDKPGSIPPPMNTDVNFRYLRFHGPDGNYRGHYDADFIADYAGLVVEWLRDGLAVYAYFNNTMGEAVANLRQLNSYAEAESQR
jgi:uncharacterized protein YecE (DUF72 family)